MAFCTNCGTKIEEEMKFCPECEAANTRKKDVDQQKQQDTGKVIKCPTCGDVLKPFVSTCPSCGYELRETKGSASVREFVAKLERIEANREVKKTGFFSGNSNMDFQNH